MATVTSVTKQPKPVSFAASGNNTAIAGESGKAIALHAVALTFASAVDVVIKDSDGNEMGTFQGVLGITLGDTGCHNNLFVCAPGASLVVSLSSAVSCKGTLWYSQYKV